MTAPRQFAFTEEDIKDPGQLAYLLNRLLSVTLTLKATLDAIADGVVYKKVVGVDGTHKVTPASINVAQLSAIAADVGILTAGQLHNAGNDAGVLLSGALPGGWLRYLDLVAAHVTFLKHDKLTLNYDGTATFNGTLRSQVGGSVATAPAAQLLYQTSSASTVSAVEVSVASYVIPASALATNGDTVRVTALVTLSAAGDTAKFKLGGTTLFTALPAGTNGLFLITILITRLGATSERITPAVIPAHGLPSLGVVRSAAEDLSTALTLDFRAFCGAGGQVIYEHVAIEFLGA